LLRRSRDHQPVAARELVSEIGQGALRRVAWREGSNRKLQSRFTAVRVWPAHRDSWRAEPDEEAWLLAEWPRRSAEPTKYWLANLPAETTLEELVRLAKHRWIVERDYLELKQEFPTGPFRKPLVVRVSPSRYAVHCGLWVPGSRKKPFFASARAGRLELAGAEPTADYRPRGSAGARAEA